MSEEKPTTPMASPKVTQSAKLDQPSTPPSQKKTNRLSSSFLETPDHRSELPFSPSLKRLSDGNYRSSPDYKFSHNVQSPYTTPNLLKTPRRSSGYDSDENESNVKYKLQKTPQYFSPGKRLFADDNDNNSKKDNLNEITSQLKGKLTNALDKVQKQKQNNNSNKFNFTELSFNSDRSPTRKTKSSLQRDLSEDDSIRRANLNLQTLTNSNNEFSSPSQKPSTMTSFSNLQNSPTINDNKLSKDRLINLPSPDEESSAHNALMATLSRQKASPIKKQRRPLSLDSSAAKYKLPPINMALGNNAKSTPNTNPNTTNGPKDKNNEEDAVFSLMSLSSPQSVKFGHSRTQSYNNNSPISSRSSSVVLPNPNSNPSNQPTNLPPISGIMNQRHLISPQQNHQNDNDATDVEDDDTDDYDNDNDSEAPTANDDASVSASVSASASATDEDNDD